jgi:hypothetical protein
MHPSTEKLLRRKLSMDLAEPTFLIYVLLFMAGMGLLALFGGYILRPLEEGRPLLQQAPQHQHKGSKK